MIKLSIIIPAYNVGKYINRCIDSLYQQDLSVNEYEVIVVNDGSVDNTLNLLMEYNKPNLHIFSQPNNKQGSARNNGLRHSKGEYIWFVDSDDWVEPNVLRHLYDIAKTNGVEMLGFNCHDKQLKFLNRVYKGEELFKNGVYKSAPWATIFRRTWLISNNLFFLEGCIYEDNEFMPRAYGEANKVMYIDYRIYHYEYNELSSINNRIVPKWVFDGFTQKIIPSMLEYAESKRDSNKQLSSVLFSYIFLTFNTLLLKLDSAEPDVFKIVKQDIAKISGKIIQAAFKSKVLKYKIEGSFLWILPFSFFFKLHTFIQQAKQV